MGFVESRHVYQLEAEIPMAVAEQLFGMCEATGQDMDAVVTEAIQGRLKGGVR